MIYGLNALRETHEHPDLPQTNSHTLLCFSPSRAYLKPTSFFSIYPFFLNNNFPYCICFWCTKTMSATSRVVFCTTISCCCLLLLLSPFNEATARNFAFSGPSTETETATDRKGGYVTVKPRFDLRHEILNGKQLKNCMPKGFRHSSAPSRFVNYHILGSPACSTQPNHHRHHSNNNP